MVLRLIAFTSLAAGAAAVVVLLLTLPRITIFNASRVSGFAEAMRSHGKGVGA